MKKLFKILLFVLGGLLVVLLLTWLFFQIKWKIATTANMKLLGEAAPVLLIDGYQFRDLNKNGELDTYEDSRAAIDLRLFLILMQKAKS